MMRRIALLRLGFLTVLLGLSQFLQAQSADLSKEKETALRFLQANPTQFNLEAQDVSDVRITDAYVSRHNGVTHVWVQQQYAGIPVYNALFGLHVKPDGSVLHLGHRFVPQLSGRVNTTLPSLGAARALEVAMQQLGFAGFDTPALQRKIDERNWVFEGGAVASAEIPVRICYALDQKGQPRLAWNLYIDQANTSDLWTICVDAQTGQILQQLNHTVYCKAGHAHLAGEDCREEATVQEKTTQVKKQAVTGAADETYRVFPLPAESPIHGTHELVINPADPTASPFGWLDEDGVDGADFTYTRGNNVWAFEDSASDNTPSPDESADGGADLMFDFPFDPNAEPEDNLNAAVTNLFYMNNMMHDITYRFGFDEVSGNFQTNNYGHGGQGGDAVLAQAIDGGGENNANFATPSDGGPGRMQMFRWSGQSGNIVSVNAPGALIGTYYGRPASGWGGAISNVPVTGEVVITDDGTGSGDATKNCNPPVNNLQGKIAMVDRGVCEFGRKALNAEQAGAIACIICNFEDATIGMGGGAVGGQVTIPTVMMTKPDCDLLRQYAGAGLNISLVEPLVSGPAFLDGDFDNGIIAHEYGHGISNRLTGGPNANGCLGNAEQMGEGWSDWFTLVTTVSDADVAEKRRGVGTYVLRQPTDGQGIRRYPYSTDMSINPVTFSTVAQNTQVHALGEIWAAVTWDLYWAMVEKYGFDSDLSNTNSGNYRAIQLVMDGMKLQPCSPGFIDGRDGIMAADMLNYDGVDTCLISEVFARRGMGYFADQGDNNNAADGFENFDPIPTCVKELKIRKETSTPLLFSGDNAEFTITVTNHKDDPVTNVVVTDPLPAGLTLVSASNGGTDNNGVVTWDLGTMASGEVIILTYSAQTNPSAKSQLFFRDEMETEGDSWISLVNNNEGVNIFYLQGDSVQVGTYAWKADAPDTETDQSLLHYLPVTITGAQPVMRFWHNYDTEAGADAGFLEIQIDGDNQWRRIAPEKVFRKGYPTGIQYGTFAIPFLSGFSGNSGGWIQSYFDLSEYIGENILFQFRFGTDDNTNVPNGGWYIDQVDIMDMLNYESEACVTSAEGDQACDSAPERGVIIDPDSVVDTDEPVNNALGLQVQPNPVRDVLSLSFGEDASGPVRILLIGADGRLVAEHNTTNVHAGQVFPLNVQHLPAGMYVVRVENSKGSSVVKVAKQ
ncbi:MAG: DUF11 domain-containing protein [Bacteroidetes bacterium]|nr:MAG: DUF11 domain-containing protein [Bacteroidota bacterium]